MPESKPKLTAAQHRVLMNLAADRSPAYGFALGRSTAGGLTGTFASLRRRGFTDRHDSITPAGRAALNEGGE